MTEISIERRRANRAPTAASAWLVWTARFGYAARGIVYLALGLMAIAVAVGLAERPRGITGVLREIVRLPLGEVLLVGLTAGFVAYAALNFVGAVWAPRGRSTVGAAARRLLAVADIVTGALYVAFAGGVVRIRAQPAAQGGRLLEALAATALGVPGGRALLGLGGVVVAIVGVALSVKAFHGEFAARLDRRSLSPGFLRLVDQLARAGTLARGLVFVLCGALAVWSAADRSPAHMGDVGDALARVAATAFGPVVVAVLGVCFCGYGAYQLVKMRWRVLGFGETPEPN